MKKEYLLRFITAGGILSIIALVGFFHSPFIIWLFLSLIAILGFYEGLNIFLVPKEFHNFLTIVASIFWITIYFYPNPMEILFLTIILISSLIAYKNYPKQSILAFLYPLAGVMVLFILYKEYSIMPLIWLLVIVALTDIGAFFIGKSFGKTKFSITSPNKTLEGVFGGVLIGTIGGIFLGLQINNSLIFVSIVTLLASIISIFGDLFESFLKREAGIKDSGNILPGHGGVLDRVDGYLFSGIVLLIALRFT